jgi:hypothetical protein
MWTLHGKGMVYGADFSIDPEYQSKGGENPSGFSRTLAILCIPTSPEHRFQC